MNLGNFLCKHFINLIVQNADKKKKRRKQEEVFSFANFKIKEFFMQKSPTFRKLFDVEIKEKKKKKELLKLHHSVRSWN